MAMLRLPACALLLQDPEEGFAADGGCGASAKPTKETMQLRQSKAQLQESQREVSSGGQPIQLEAEKLVRTVSRRSQEAGDVLRLERELLAASASHARELSWQRESFQAEHAQLLELRLEQVEHTAEQALQDGEAARRDDSMRQETEELFANQLARAEFANRYLIQCEEQRVTCAQEELLKVRAEVRILVQERDAEAEAAVVTQEAFLAEQRAAQRQGEMLRAEVRTQVSETEVLEDAHRGLEDKARSLQHELSKVTYTVGQRDHEVKVKDSELQEVRRSLACIQGEMDEVNGLLNEQCSRVQRVEGSLRVSRDLGEKARSVRGMLKESHGALAQLCGLLEQERTRREQCGHGLKQQRVRTELLLQLLHHFKSRTQDLSPQAILGSHLGNHSEGGMQ